MPHAAPKADCAPIGHAGTVSAILADIQASGPITFARFMEQALYHPEFGYYTRTTDAAGEDRIGWSGDYFTSVDIHPVFGRALARQFAQIDEQLLGPDPFTVVEMGPGKGLLARDILAACERDAPALFSRLRYVLIERSPAMIASQQRHLAPWSAAHGRVSWVHGLEALGTGSVTGVAFSNELVDAFPVHRVRIERGEPREVYVGEADGRFFERLGALSVPALAEYLKRLAALDVVLPDGATIELNLAALHWMREVARVLGRGVAITIDYGHTAQDLYGPDRRRGTLLCYSNHQVSDDPFTRVGLQDMTSHVDFTSLATVGEEEGLHLTGFTNQISFLMGLGIEQLLASLEPESHELMSAVRLLKPDGMGRTFKVLIQHRGIPAPALDGLRYKPFFGSVLVPGSGQPSAVSPQLKADR
jgi:SAM-dependent MidA family methyltransferase